MKDKISDLISKNRDRTDYLEIRIENNDTTSIRFMGKKLHTLNQSKSYGGYVRSCYKGAWGFCSFNEVEKLETYIDKAIEQSDFLARSKEEKNQKTVLASLEPVKNKSLFRLRGKDPSKISIGKKVELFEHYTSLLNSYSDLISTSTARYFEKTQNILFLNSEGTCVEHGWTDMEARFSATIQKNGMVQVAQESLGSRKGFEEIKCSILIKPLE